MSILQTEECERTESPFHLICIDKMTPHAVLHIHVQEQQPEKQRANAKIENAAVEQTTALPKCLLQIQSVKQAGKPQTRNANEAVRRT